ncbi:hypothetical protein GCM10007866_28430 [Gluconobacter albidus]|uniref:Uncharacterized protein n=1 Tax=Gluconobacter albidus TaxID=318683 RepID=A0ABQ5X4Q0_9PROT|nr:hypothetical protein GCM10007866_28430 [Gluconobacter albidus]
MDPGHSVLKWLCHGNRPKGGLHALTRTDEQWIICRFPQARQRSTDSRLAQGQSVCRSGDAAFFPECEKGGGQIEIKA